MGPLGTGRRLVRCPGSRKARSRLGYTFVELVIFMILVLVGLLMSSSTMVMVSRQRNINRENAAAAEGARSLIEEMRNRPLDEVFALYNADPADDPGGAGTAPGNRFAVAGLGPAPDAADGLIGTILFPTVDVGPAGGPVDLELRENIADATFGTPRDLNGDSIIDGVDHTDDYLLLPVRLRLRWSGSTGVRQYEAFATFCQWNWE